MGRRVKMPESEYCGRLLWMAPYTDQPLSPTVQQCSRGYETLPPGI